MRNSILTADLHLTSLARDAYRFGIFPQLMLWQKQYKAKHLFILGDVTDAKDYHSSLLVNRVVDEVAGLAEGAFEKVWILKGNHDGVDPRTPYFRFLNAIPGVEFIVEPGKENVEGESVFFLPHTRTPEEDWSEFDFDKYDTVLAHYTAAGASSESGFVLDGVGADALHGTRVPIISGDVHIPQTLDNLTYVGTPYHVRFLENENAPPRCMLFDNAGKQKDLHYKCLSRRTLAIEHPDQLAKCTYNKGDQVKVRLTLARADFGQWFEYRRQVQEWCAASELDLVSVELKKQDEVSSTRPRIKKASTLSHADMLAKYCKAKKVPDALVEAGEKLLKEGV